LYNVFAAVSFAFITTANITVQMAFSHKTLPILFCDSEIFFI